MLEFWRAHHISEVSVSVTVEIIMLFQQISVLTVCIVAKVNEMHIFHTHTHTHTHIYIYIYIYIYTHTHI